MRQRYPAPYRPASDGGDAPDAAAVLANRIAAALAHHKPGWTLPRQSVLARRYHVTTRQVAAAIDELAARRCPTAMRAGSARQSTRSTWPASTAWSLASNRWPAS